MEKKTNINDLWLKLIFVLLTILTTGVGWLVVQNNYRLDKHDTEIIQMKESISDLRNISSNLIEAYNGKVEKDRYQDLAIEKQRDEILELWKCAKRSGQSVDNTLKN